MKILATIFGILLLLPGVCSLAFTGGLFTNGIGRDFFVNLAFWVAGIVIASGGMLLIRWALRR